jgi:DNA polymerase III epsilon subunit-like protein
MAEDLLQLKSNLCDLFCYYEQILVFDVETTGFDALNDEIIEITLVELKMENGKTVIREVEDYYINLKTIDVIDTLTIYKDRRPYPHKLSDAVEAYGLAAHVRNSHRSIDAAIATLYVFDAMCIEYNDVRNYINLFGVNPKYGLKQKDRIKTIRYCNQPYASKNKLYELAE